ncbi:MAG: PTS sugar transporter subunit IIB [Gemmatimonadota bacterium]|nr:PTS sugar transporter subunit IIB [Gemmatimonadota bacterium]
MPIALFRVDERLIHGQVVVGWGKHLGVDRIAVIDDEVVASPWERDLYCLGVPSEVGVVFASVQDARHELAVWRADPRRIIVLVRDVETLARLAQHQLLDHEEINLGGIHFAPGRERLLPYLFLSPEECERLREVARSGAVITARDLPGTRPVTLDDLLPEE